MKSLSPKNIYIVLHSCVKPYKCIEFYTKFYVLHLHKCKWILDTYIYTLCNKFHYKIYIYSECKSQTIYMHNTDYNLQPVSWFL